MRCINEALGFARALTGGNACVCGRKGATTQIEAVVEVEVTSAFGPGYDQRFSLSLSIKASLSLLLSLCSDSLKSLVGWGALGARERAKAKAALALSHLHDEAR